MSLLFANFQMKNEFGAAPVRRRTVPAGVFQIAILSASAGFDFWIVRYAEIGLWIHEPRPEARKRLLPASSHDSTSGSIASLYSALTYLTTSKVALESIVTCLPVSSHTDAPALHSMLL